MSGRDTADYASLCGTPMTQRKEKVGGRRYVGYEIATQSIRDYRLPLLGLCPFLPCVELEDPEEGL